MRTPIALALFAMLAFVTSPATPPTELARRAYRTCITVPIRRHLLRSLQRLRPHRPRLSSISVSNFWMCPDSSKPSRSSSGRACRPSLSNGYSCPGQQARTKGPPRRKRRLRHRNRSADAARACQTATSAQQIKVRPETPARTNTRRQGRRGRIAPTTLSFGPTPAPTFIISAELPIMATR